MSNTNQNDWQDWAERESERLATIANELPPAETSIDDVLEQLANEAESPVVVIPEDRWGDNPPKTLDEWAERECERLGIPLDE